MPRSPASYSSRPAPGAARPLSRYALQRVQTLVALMGFGILAILPRHEAGIVISGAWPRTSCSLVSARANSEVTGRISHRPFRVWLAVVKLASQLAFGRQCCVADLRRGRFDLAGATGRATCPAWRRAPLDRHQERRRLRPPASGRGRLWDAGAAPARLAATLVVLAPGRQATQRPLPAAHT
jgi:hypothetical protein